MLLLNGSLDGGVLAAGRRHVSEIKHSHLLGNDWLNFGPIFRIESIVANEIADPICSGEKCL